MPEGCLMDVVMTALALCVCVCVCMCVCAAVSPVLPGLPVEPVRPHRRPRVGPLPIGEAHGAGQGCVPVLPLDQCDMHFRPDPGSLPQDHPGSGVVAPWLPPGQQCVCAKGSFPIFLKLRVSTPIVLTSSVRASVAWNCETVQDRARRPTALLSHHQPRAWASAEFPLPHAPVPPPLFLPQSRSPTTAECSCTQTAGGEPGPSCGEGGEKRKRVGNANRNERSRWRLAAVGGWWQLAVGGGWRLVVLGGYP